jgi:hypothetical protein
MALDKHPAILQGAHVEDVVDAKLAVRDGSGRFVRGHSGNPTGRRSGSREEIQLCKLIAEEAIRSGQMPKMIEVCKTIITQALAGDFDSQKLVWQSIMTKGVNEEKKGGEGRVQIIIGEAKEKVVTTIEATPIEDPIPTEAIEETNDEQERQADSAPAGAG